MDNIKQTGRDVIFTIGHSDHGLEKFISLLKDIKVELVVDIRSKPYSRYAARFNKASIKISLNVNGIKYLFLGDKLGGRPDDKRFYDPEGHVSYTRISETPEFHEGIKRLIKGCKEHRLALMCSEENPINCHRYHLISKVLEKKDMTVVHIRGDGRQQSHEELSREIEVDTQKEKQLKLFS